MTQPLTHQEVALAKECGTLGSSTTEDIIAILVRMCPGFDVEAFLRVAGGRQWYVPTPGRAKIQARYLAILSFPSRNYKVVADEFGVSKNVVYRAWQWGKRRPTT